MKPIAKKKSNMTGNDKFESSSKTIQYVDGRKFFELAREKLPFDKFNKIIKEIQKMNKNQQSKEETFRICEEVIEKKNKELCLKLRALIYHKIT